MAQLNTNTRYLYDILHEYASKLLSKLPSKLNKIFFVNSGSEANDLAIRMAKVHTGHEKIMVLEHGYHGHTQTGIDISDYKFNNPKAKVKRNLFSKQVYLMPTMVNIVDMTVVQSMQKTPSMK